MKAPAHFRKIESDRTRQRRGTATYLPLWGATSHKPAPTDQQKLARLGLGTVGGGGGSDGSPREGQILR